MRGGVNRWLSPELVAAAQPPSGSAQAARGARPAAPPLTSPGPGSRRWGSTGRRSHRLQSLAVPLAWATLIAAVAALGHNPLMTAVEALRSAAPGANAARPAAPPAAPPAVVTATPAATLEDADLAPARAQVHSLREANDELRNRLSELEAALQTPIPTEPPTIDPARALSYAAASAAATN